MNDLDTQIYKLFLIAVIVSFYFGFMLAARTRPTTYIFVEQKPEPQIPIIISGKSDDAKPVTA